MNKYLFLLLPLLFSSPAFSAGRTICEGYSPGVIADFLNVNQSSCKFNVIKSEENYPAQTDTVAVKCNNNQVDGTYKVTVILSLDGYQDQAPACDPSSSPTKVN